MTMHEASKFLNACVSLSCKQNLNAALLMLAAAQWIRCNAASRLHERSSPAIFNDLSIAMLLEPASNGGVVDSQFCMVAHEREPLA